MMYIGQNINCILFVLKVNCFNKADPSQMPDCPDTRGVPKVFVPTYIEHSYENNSF